MKQDIATVLDFWFGPLTSAGVPEDDRHPLWFRKDPATDANIKTQFGPLVERALAGELNHWADSDDGLIALIILLDQFPRNLFRDTPRAFAGDPLALPLALSAIESGRHRQLPAIYRVFLYLPLEHSEDLAAQDQCVALFRALEADSSAIAKANFRQFAEAHRDVIARFGRFPHRNSIVGRESTTEELAHLESHGGF